MVEPFADPSLSFETPERVALSLDVAGLGTRALAYLIDALIILFFWLSILVLVSVARKEGVGLEDFSALASLAQAALVCGLFAVQWGYWVFFESLWNGRSPGKRAIGIRVVKTDGSPADFTDAALRNLGRVGDFLPVFYGVGLTAMMISSKSRRLGDLLAGTLVVRERRADLSRYGSVSFSEAASGLALSPAETELVLSFLARADQMAHEARGRVALKIAEPFAERLLPEKRGAPMASPAAAEAFLKSLVGEHG